MMMMMMMGMMGNSPDSDGRGMAWWTMCQGVIDKDGTSSPHRTCTDDRMEWMEAVVMCPESGK